MVKLQYLKLTQLYIYEVDENLILYWIVIDDKQNGKYFNRIME